MRISEPRYGNKKRGTIPVGWTMSTGLADFAPMASATYFNEKTANDTFIAAPSGAGYQYPWALKEGADAQKVF
jgi:hypothetical protein